MLEVYERAYKICQMLQCWLLSTSTSTKLHRDCGITVCTIKRKVILSNVKQKCGPLPLGSAVNLNKFNLIEIELFIKMLYGVWSSLQPDHERNKSPRRMQVSPPARNDYRSPIWNVLRSLISFLSLPRISTKNFPYIKGKIDWSIRINYSSVNFKWTQDFLSCQWFDRRGQCFFEKYRSCRISLKQRVSLWVLWHGWKLRWIELSCVRRPTSQEMNCKISEESRKRTFPIRTLCMYDSLFVIYTVLRAINRSCTNVTRCPLHRNRRKAKNYHGQYLLQKGNLVKLFVNRQEI